MLYNMDYEIKKKRGAQIPTIEGLGGAGTIHRVGREGGEEVALQWRCRGEVVQRRRRPGDGASRRWLRPSLDQVRFCRWAWRLTVNLVLRAAGPTSFYSAVRRGPTNHVGLSALDQGARSRPNSAVGPSWRDHH